MKSSRHPRCLAAACGLITIFLGCGADPTPASGNSSGQGGTASASSSTAVTVSSSGNTGGGGSGGDNFGPSPPPPTAEDLGFKPLNALPTDERIVFNDWSAPDRVKAMRPDGSDVLRLFEVRRVWSLGISNDRSKIAFSCTDPQQEENFGTTFTDSIQQTWIYDVATQTIRNLNAGNINDECHIFSPDDDTLYLCRRYDFKADGSFSGYRVAAVDPSSGNANWLTASSPNTFTLTPQPTADGKSLWFSHILIEGSSQTRSIRKLLLPNGDPEIVLMNASRPVFSPDGQRLMFSNSLDQGKLYVADLDGNNAIQVTSVRGTSATFSPDGKLVAYLRWDASAVCSHIESVASDGSTKDAPVRLRDCEKSGENITQLRWLP